MRSLFKMLLISTTILMLSCKNSETPQDEVSVDTGSVEEYNDIALIEPPNWWTGFKNNNLQLLIHDSNISGANVEIDYPGLSIEKVHKAESPNYLFVDLKIAEAAKAGKFNIKLKFEDGTEKIRTYELKSREKPAEDYEGFDSSDAVYLITPDRFANAQPENDINNDLKETSIDRSLDYARHGGDIKGITEHLDYIDEMGFTAIWSCPLLINDMPQWSYHGYAITDYYRVDPRFGTLEEYRELADKAREKGIKLIMDQVANHCGLEHWWMKDLPFKDWVNYQKGFEEKEQTRYSNHRRTVNQDIYASQVDKEGMSDGWFVDAMPDLNQRNPFMARYIIQNSIWWIETLGLGGIRQDTYPYPDKDFMATWAGAIMKEYPNFSIVGEEWSYNPLLIAYWQEGADNKDGYDSNLRSAMDFAMQSLIVQGISEEENWDKGLIKLYEGLANDFAYASPKDMMVFPDNHDMDRVFTQFGEDVTNTKMGLSYLLTLPRIPQLYYGTEILMQNSAKPGDHGLIRTDFPGGWNGDPVNAFTGEGLTDAQKDMQSYLKKILNYRKNSKAIHEGKTIHFAPDKGVYVLFRISDEETVVHILNKNEAPLNLDLDRFKEVGLEGKTLENIINGEKVVWKDALELKGKGSVMLSTKTN
ncbi:alpha-amylase [Leptobacterium flavescens]|uniref:Alpha-amylase n=1 Tax=Leptobacterium flavescens TaxID=472055 RepID=A0A6P0UN04_9FLAO|nr:glycoside hydrolase family 13 protein [Leptobacterium flavescens]NER14654.1 alpha-amylase [Leptobacterium flavescens]